MIRADVPLASYVADDFGGDAPTLNSSVAHLLVSKSPLHAWTAHPRLNPDWAPDVDGKFDLGVAAHCALLENKGPAEWVIPCDEAGVPYEDWRRKAAQTIRDEARAAGKIPLLQWQADGIAPMVANALRKLADCPDLLGVSSSLDAERTITWTGAQRVANAYVALRCRPDWITADRKLIVSYKTSGSAHPDDFARLLAPNGYDMQAAFELAAIKAETGKDAHYVWLVGETEAPYACSLFGLTPELWELASSKMQRAVSEWAKCLSTDTWPGYPPEIMYLSPPPWETARWLEQESRR